MSTPFPLAKDEHLRRWSGGCRQNCRRRCTLPRRGYPTSSDSMMCRPWSILREYFQLRYRPLKHAFCCILLFLFRSNGVSLKQLLNGDVYFDIAMSSEDTIQHTEQEGLMCLMRSFCCNRSGRDGRLTSITNCAITVSRVQHGWWRFTFLTTRFVRLGRFGKRFITENKMSPDGVVQMSIVYAYYALYGNLVSVYEPVMTKVMELQTLGGVDVAIEIFLISTLCR